MWLFSPVPTATTGTMGASKRESSLDLSRIGKKPENDRPGKAQRKEQARIDDTVQPLLDRDVEAVQPRPLRGLRQKRPR